MITVFTPTYNRAYIISSLYESLKSQAYKDFEWLIVDDGSSDNTEALISDFIDENLIGIRYIKQPNGGKHRAINKGVSMANGELCFIVDSDDYLPDNSLERVAFYFDQIKDNLSFAGVSGRCAYYSHNKEIVGNQMPDQIIDSTSLDIRFKHGVVGDLAEVFRTEVLKEFPFPEIDGEYFCPEALVWNRIAQKYQIRFFDEPIYYCEYLPDGLSAKIAKLRMDSPKASMTHYSELSKMKIPSSQKVKAIINFWRFSICSGQSFYKKWTRINKVGIILFPIGYMMYLNDCKK